MKNILNDATVIDVRTSQEFAVEHFPGAVNIPLDQVPYHVDEFKKMKKPLVLYCRSGARSSSALNFLREAGFSTTEVYNGGGLEDMLSLTAKRA